MSCFGVSWQKAPIHRIGETKIETFCIILKSKSQIQVDVDYLISVSHFNQILNFKSKNILIFISWIA